MKLFFKLTYSPVHTTHFDHASQVYTSIFFAHIHRRSVNKQQIVLKLTKATSPLALPQAKADKRQVGTKIFLVVVADFYLYTCTQTQLTKPYMSFTLQPMPLSV